MKASELRIGNFLRDKSSKTILKVIELTEKDIMTYVIDRSKYPLKYGWAIEPIPLTEQWLLDFGFKKYDTYYTKKYGKRVKYHKVTHRFSDESEYYREPYFVYNSSRIEIKHVHQLQNLHHALTGEELIKQ